MARRTLTRALPGSGALLAVAILVGCGSTAPRTAVAGELDRAVATAGDAVQVSALVVDLETDAVVYERRADLLLHPASTMKLLTTATLLHRAPDWSAVTRLEAGGLPEGRLRLVAGGDPLLSSGDVRALVQELRTAGLERVRGPLVVHDPMHGRPPFGHGWMWDDEPAPFMPHLSGAVVDGGAVTVEVTGGADGLRVDVEPPGDHVRVVVSHEPGAGGLRITRKPGERTVTVTGALPEGGSERRSLSVPDPARHTGHVLAGLLRDAGLAGPDIAVSVAPGPPPGDRVTAAEAAIGRSAEEIVRHTNKESDNLAAELLLRHLPHAAAPPADRPMGTAGEGLDELRRHVEALGLDPDGYRLVDGSGVSHYGLVSARLLVRVLAGIERAGGRARALLRASLPVAGEDGTLAARMRGTPAAGRVRAKTGTLSGVSTLAGYVDTESGRRLAFAVLVQNYVGRAAPWRALQDDFCSVLARLGGGRIEGP